MIAVLGAGPHGRQIAHDLNTDRVYDDHLSGYEPCLYGAQNHRWVIGAVWPHVRRQIAAAVESEAVACHKEGIVISPRAWVGVEVGMGEHVHVLAGATVSHGCQIGDFATIATGAILCGEVTVGADAFIGAGAVVVHGGISIGAGAFVCAGSVVTADIPAGVKVH